MTYTICEPCIDVKDRTCVDECPVDCIYEGGRMLYIQPDECVDCGACEPVCPVTAIFYEDDVPSEWKQFTPIEFSLESSDNNPQSLPVLLASEPVVNMTGQVHIGGETGLMNLAIPAVAIKMMKSK